jgi:hypothetical protein
MAMSKDIRGFGGLDAGLVDADVDRRRRAMLTPWSQFNVVRALS